MSELLTRKTVFWSIVALLLASIAYRAYALSFTIDEAMSYNYVLGLWEDDLRANDHWLNTFFMRVCNLTLGSSEWSLRLPNVLSFLLYSAAVFGLIRNLKSRLLFYSSAAVLLFQPAFLEFFSLARGYGMGVAFFAYGFYLLVSVIRTNNLNTKQKAIRYLGVIIMGGLVMFSYAAALNLVLMMMGAAVVHALWKWNAENTQLRTYTLVAMILFAAGFTLKSALLLLELRDAGELYIGTSTYGKWLGNTFAYYFPADLSPSILVMRLATLIAGLVLVISGFVNAYQRRRMSYLSGLAFIVGVGSLLGWVIQHEVMEANLPQDRTSMIYFFIIAAGLVGIVTLPSSNRWIEGLSKYSFGLIAALSVWNAVVQYDTKNTRMWELSSSMREVALTADSFAQHWHEPVHVERHYFFISNLNYYFRTQTEHIVVDEDFGIDLKDEIVIVKDDDFRFAFDDPKLIEQYHHIVTYSGVVSLYVRNDVYEKAMESGDVKVYR